MRTVCAFGLDGEMVKLYLRAQDGPRKTQVKRAGTQGAGFGFSQSVMFAMYPLTFWYGSRLVDGGEMGAGAHPSATAP